MASPTGPATAIEMGISASETKKSRLDTRPSIAGGTRICSSVPHNTCAPENSSPQTNSAANMMPSHEVRPMTASGRHPKPHARIISVR